MGAVEFVKPGTEIYKKAREVFAGQWGYQCFPVNRLRPYHENRT